MVLLAFNPVFHPYFTESVLPPKKNREMVDSQQLVYKHPRNLEGVPQASRKTWRGKKSF